MLSGGLEIEVLVVIDMTQVPDWIEESPEEIEEMVIELADRGNSPSDIGRILRDEHGIPSVKEIMDKSVLEILQENNEEPDLPEDLLDLMRKAVNLREHLDRNPKDNRSQRSLNTLESRIQKIAKYYKKEEKLPQNWRYDPEEAALLVRG